MSDKSIRALQILIRGDRVNPDYVPGYSKYCSAGALWSTAVPANRFRGDTEAQQAVLGGLRLIAVATRSCCTTSLERKFLWSEAPKEHKSSAHLTAVVVVVMRSQLAPRDRTRLI